MGRALHNVLVAILLSNTQQEQLHETPCSHTGYINNFVLMANTTYCIKHIRSCETTAVFTVGVDILRFLFPLFYSPKCYFPSCLNSSSQLTVSKAFCKARGLHCLDHLYHYTSSFFQIALYSLISCCKNMYIITQYTIFNHISKHQLNFYQFT